jgi:hypothetical protein
MKPLWLLGLLGLCACGSAPAEPRPQLTEFRLYRTMGCYETALQTNGAQIDFNPDGTVEISTWTGQQASQTPSKEIGRRLYEFGLDLKNPIYLEPKASNRYMDVVGIVKDLQARGYKHVRLMNLPA